MPTPGSRRRVPKTTACANCAHFNNLMISWPGGGGMGVCRHKDGPTGKVQQHEWFSSGTRYYPGGCPRDPNPRVVRQRPKKKRGAKPAPSRHRAAAPQWDCEGSPSPQERRAPTIAEQEDGDE